MERKKSLFKHVLLVMMAFFFLSAGVVCVAQSAKTFGTAFASTQPEQVENTPQPLPDYFLRQELYDDASGSKTGSLIDGGVFLFNRNTQNQSHALFSFLTNGVKTDDANGDIYEFVNYPDVNNSTLFNFYSFENISLTVNGESQTLPDEVKTESQPYFSNSTIQNHHPQKLALEIGKTATDGQSENNRISVLDENGNVREGAWTLNISYYLYTCTDGRTDGQEEEISESDLLNISYTFYVLDESNYISSNKPVVQTSNFDSRVDINSTTRSEGMFLYSHYASLPSGSTGADKTSSATAANQIPSLEYNINNFEVSITRTFGGDKTTQTLLLDIAENGTKSVQSSGDLVKSKLSGDKMRLYFTNLGEYEVKLSAITVVDFHESETVSTTKKFAVDTLSQNTKTVNVFMFGYQATYTDFDGVPDDNNILPTQELKSYDLQNNTFYQSADMTSLLLNSANFVKTSGDGNEVDLKNTFEFSNIANVLNAQTDGTYTHRPVKTNQTPINLATNSSEVLDTQYHRSLIFSTNQNTITSASAGTLQGQTYYSGTYNGGSISQAGKYLFILPYTYQNFYVSEQIPATNQVFYQVFFFEISTDLSEISVTTVPTQEGEQSKAVASNTFVNTNVCVNDTTKSSLDLYNRDVVVQIYAQDFGGNYLAGFNGQNGISLSEIDGTNLDADSTKNNQVQLSQSAHYTIRLYYQNTYASTNTSIQSTTGFFRQQYFTIDTNKTFNITAHNFKAIEGTDDFEFVSTLDGLSTNQSFAVSWSDKASGAKTEGYYRFFPFVEASYFGADENSISSLLSKMLQMEQDSAYMPINKVLNLSAQNNYWLPYQKIASTSQTLELGQVFTNAGLYLFDVWDEAGNRSVNAFVLDNTTPLFALQQESKFALALPTQYISANATLYWGDYKAIYMANFNENFYIKPQQYNPENVSTFKEELAQNKFYLDTNNNLCTEIYEILYEKFYFENKLFQYISPNVTKSSDVSALISNYNGMYVTVAIDDLSYYVDNHHQMETRQTGNSHTFEVDRADDEDTDAENTYTVYIRDASNTVWDEFTANHTAAAHYRRYYSATQTIEVSFDASEFRIYFESDSGTKQILHSTLSEVDRAASTKTIYFTPINLEKALQFSFVPLVEEEGAQSVQVESVTLSFTPYELVSKPIYAQDGETILGYENYYEISSDETKVVTDTLYTHDGGQSTTQTLRLNGKNITTEGKYELTRTYTEGDGYIVKNKDYKTRTFVLYVDRYDVVTNGESAKGGAEDVENGEHLESLVGGDIFVSMFNTKHNINLVVNFPNSESGNTDGVTLKNILTTNKLPVGVYVPAFKYTTSAEKISTDGQNSDDYDFEVHNNENMSNFNTNLLLKDYVLFASIYRNGALIGTTSTEAVVMDSQGNAVLDESAIENGFLKFYQPNSSTPLGALTAAGEYRVQIMQGYFGRTTITPESGQATENYTFERSFSFTFSILQATPNFEVSSNGPLNSQTSNQSGIQTFYYTNKSEVTLTWAASTSKYMVEIDQDGTAMKFVAPGQDPIYAKDGNGNYTNIWSSQPTSNGNTWTGVIDLQRLGVYTNGRFVDISMQFKNHDETQSYYTTSVVTKRIYVDLVAPDQNVEQLADNAVEQSEIAALTKQNIRRYQTANRQVTTNTNDRSFNLSAVNEPFAYYSYFVPQSYLQTLKGSVDFATYVKAIAREDKYASNTNAQETDPDNFRESNYTNIATLEEFESDTYYEVVETDRAGNMAIYTIFVMDNTSTDETKSHNIISFTTTQDGVTTDGAYTSGDYNLVKNSAHEGAKHNIYSKTQFALSGLDFFGDEWAEFTLSTFDASGRQIKRTYMLNPYDKNNAFYFSGNTYSRVPISSLIDGSFSSSQKHSLSFKNRAAQNLDEQEVFYISVYNISLTAQTTSQQTREYIRFDSASDSAITSATTATKFLTHIKISLNGSPIFEKGVTEENPYSINKLGFAEDWLLSAAELATNNRVIVSKEDIGGGITQILFELNPIYSYTPNSRITYEFMDNFGQTYTELHLFRESIEREITALNTLYQYYNTDFERLFYITDNGFEYHYNPNKYSVRYFSLNAQKERETISSSTAITTNTAANGITTLTFGYATANNYASHYVIDVYSLPYANIEAKLIKSVYFTLYNKLPSATYASNPSTSSGNTYYIVDANGTNITSRITGVAGDVDANGYFSQIRIVYQTDAVGTNGAILPVKFSYSTDRMIWTELSSGETLKNLSDELETYYLKIWYDQQYLQNYAENGNQSGYVFQDVPPERIYAFNLSSQNTTFWVEVTRNGVTEVLHRSRNPFISTNGEQYANHYLVNIQHENSNAVQIQVNREQEITKTFVTTYQMGNGVLSDLWLIQNSGNGNVPAFRAYIVITFVPPPQDNSNNIMEELFTFSQDEGMLDTSQEANLANASSTRFVVEEGSSLKRVEIQWSRYYAYTQNEINVTIVKDNTLVLRPEIFERTENDKQYFYTYLTYSGTYRLTFQDEAGNIHRFNRNSGTPTPYFTYEFLQDVPFTISYTHPITGQEISTLPSKQATYNGAVTLKLDKDTFNTLYTPDGRPRISVKRNGKEYQRDDFANVRESYTFDEAGFYEVSFSATESKNGIQLKQEVYQFTILNAEENRISYVYNKYSNYFVKRVLKDGVDITSTLVQSAQDLGAETVTVPTRTQSGTANLQYLTSLPLAYNSLHTGVGKYTITICSNNSLYESSIVQTQGSDNSAFLQDNPLTTWTFVVSIKNGTAPISVSVAEGKSTIKTITATFNQENIYNEMGECTIQIVRLNKNGTLGSTGNSVNITRESTGIATLSIGSTGTYFIQVVSPSGNLMFSYKVVKTTPLNAASIIAIVVSVVVLIVVIFIVFKLRKRIAVK